jgi:hypothetical protein
MNLLVEALDLIANLKRLDILWMIQIDLNSLSHTIQIYIIYQMMIVYHQIHHKRYIIFRNIILQFMFILFPEFYNIEVRSHHRSS